MAPRRAESDFGLQGWIDTLGLKQIFLIYSVAIYLVKIVSKKSSINLVSEVFYDKSWT